MVRKKNISFELKRLVTGAKQNSMTQLEKLRIIAEHVNAADIEKAKALSIQIYNTLTEFEHDLLVNMEKD